MMSSVIVLTSLSWHHQIKCATWSIYTCQNQVKTQKQHWSLSKRTYDKKKIELLSLKLPQSNITCPTKENLSRHGRKIVALVSDIKTAKRASSFPLVPFTVNPWGYLFKAWIFLNIRMCWSSALALCVITSSRFEAYQQISAAPSAGHWSQTTSGQAEQEV